MQYGIRWAHTNNPIIEGLPSFNALKTIGSNLRIEYNKNLKSLDGLESIIEIDSFLYIRYNDNLIDLCALTNLVENNGLELFSFYVSSNAYNPSESDIQNGYCQN